MKLTDKEMKLSNLEYSVTYSGVMVGEVVLFRLNSNINDVQTEILYKEIIRRINAFEEGGLVDELRTACEMGLDCMRGLLKIADKLKASNKDKKKHNEHIKFVEDAIAKS